MLKRLEEKIDSSNKQQKRLEEKIDSGNRKLNYTGKELRMAKRQRMDCWTPSKRTQTEQTEFKQKVIEFYQRQDPNVPGNLLCMVLNRSYPRDQVRAAHMWKYKTYGKGLEEFGLEYSDVSSPRNGLILAEGIEQAFDAKQVCFFCGLGKDITLAVLDPTLLNKLVAPSTQKTFQDINGSKLLFPPGNLPFRRILNWHAKLSYEEALSRKWIDKATFDLYEDYGKLSDNASNPDYEFDDEFNEKVEEEEEESNFE